MISALIGSRGFHVFYESFDYYRQKPWDVLKVWQGGFVFYGGLIGALVGLIAVTKIKKASFWSWADFFAPVVSLGYALGRLGCFLGGCCYGRECELPWAVEFTHPGMPTGLRHPTQLYATALESLVFVFLLWLERKQRQHRQHRDQEPGLGSAPYRALNSYLQTPGALFLSWLILHGIGRIIMEVFRDDYRGAMPMGISVSAWIAATMVSVSVLVLSLRARLFRPKTPSF